ncbi:MAG: RelA/SpoT family protein [bacterium]|nr:RelA/SpoT family protein [bacterium]
MPLTIEQIIEQVKKNDADADVTMLSLAYEYAEKAHRGQKRKSGEPYIQHSLETALTLATIRSELDVVIAGLLHDVPEDTNFTINDIEKNFGKKIAFLVNGVTKLGKIKYRGIERYTESLKKMFIAMAEDIRVIIIKFADRIHNLKTLDSLPLEKQLRVANESMEIYGPIAGLLGIWHFKHQIEDLCFQYLHPEEYKKLEYKYAIEQKIENQQYIEKTKLILAPQLKEENINFEIIGRFKSLHSIFLKMQRKDRKFSEIYDVFALRIIVDTIADCYKTVGIIHSLWKPKSHRFKDYIALPKPNGYRALHTTVFGLTGKVTEFQILTRTMYEESLYGIAAHWYFKSQKPRLEQQPRWIQDILNIMRQTKDSEEFVSDIKLSVFKDRIFVFTPKGDVIDLPEGSTPVDFAYAVHTEIGNKCVGAMVNDRISTLDATLKSGDSIEIITAQNRVKPGKDWLKVAKTHRARSKIKQTIKKESGFRRYIPWG